MKKHTKKEFKYVVRGIPSIPIFQKVDRKCFSKKEAENVKDALEVVGYKTKIEAIH